ncbi:MAG: hypothetical protein LAC70_01490 [Methylovulum sp.]|nr:hypothetical protein [Methylovulum sp.]
MKKSTPFRRETVSGRKPWQKVLNPHTMRDNSILWLWRTLSASIWITP